MYVVGVVVLRIVSVSEYLWFMMYVVLVLNLKVIQIGMLDFDWSLRAFSVLMSLGHDTCHLQGPFGLAWFR